MKKTLFSSAALAATIALTFSSSQARAASLAWTSTSEISSGSPVPADTNLLLNPSFEERSGPAKDGEPWGKGYLDGVARSPFAHWGYSGFWDGGDYDIKLGRGHTGAFCARLV